MFSLDPSSSPLVLVSPRVQERVRNEFIEHVVPGVPVTPLGDRHHEAETSLCHMLDLRDNQNKPSLFITETKQFTIQFKFPDFIPNGQSTDN